MVSETNLSPSDLVMPYFIREDNDNPNIEMMPGIKRHTETELMEELESLKDLGIKAISIFPKVNKKKKSNDAKEAFNENNLVCKVLRKITKKFPELIVICDVALDAYTLNGHDGLTDSTEKIDNDSTIEVLSKMSVNFAENGCRVVAPSDMMDGRIRLIRERLESRKFPDVCILSYSSKFCSNFYSPFRDALGSKNNLGSSDKKTYQIDFRNSNEALKESLEDINEGADMVMVKPGLPYIDIVARVKQTFGVPTFAYQVSGEYAMLKGADNNGWLDNDKVVLESLMAFKRAGADGVLTYLAVEASKLLKYNLLNPLLGFKVMSAILFEALRIVFKGGKYYARKKKPKDTVSFEGSF